MWKISTEFSIRWRLNRGRIRLCERRPGLSAENEAPCDRANYGLPRLLLRQRRAWTARSSRRVAEERMAETGTVEASPADHQWLCRAVRCAERGGNYDLIGHRVAGEYR